MRFPAGSRKLWRLALAIVRSYGASGIYPSAVRSAALAHPNIPCNELDIKRVDIRWRSKRRRWERKITLGLWRKWRWVVVDCPTKTSGGGGGRVPDWVVVRKTAGNEGAYDTDSSNMEGYTVVWGGSREGPFVADAWIMVWDGSVLGKEVHGWLSGLSSEGGEEMMVSGEIERRFALFLGTWFFFRPLPEVALPLTASVVILGWDIEDTYQSKNRGNRNLLQGDSISVQPHFTSDLFRIPPNSAYVYYIVRY